MDTAFTYSLNGVAMVLLGAVTLVPVLIAFPVAAELLNNGAGITQIAGFISTLTMVGFVTLPSKDKRAKAKNAFVLSQLWDIIGCYALNTAKYHFIP